MQKGNRPRPKKSPIEIARIFLLKNKGVFATIKTAAGRKTAYRSQKGVDKMPKGRIIERTNARSADGPAFFAHLLTDLF